MVEKCLEEVRNIQTGHQLCALFVAILLHCHPSLPHVLWNSYRVKICDDLHHRLTAQGHHDPTDVFDYGLHLIQGLFSNILKCPCLNRIGMSLSLTLF